MMSEFRLIILGVGLLFIAVLYLWEVHRTRKHQRHTLIKPADVDDRIDFVLPGRPDEIDEGIISELASLRATRADEPVDDAVTLAPAHDGNSASSGEEAPIEADLSTRAHRADAVESKAKGGFEDVVVLYVMAGPGSAFSGPILLDALTDLGLRFGEMAIFHHYGMGPARSQQPLFSIANMLEPGAFDLENIERFSTSGLALFFTLPIKTDPLPVFDLMLDIASQLAERLDGRVCDQTQTALSDAYLERIRHRLVDIK